MAIQNNARIKKTPASMPHRKSSGVSPFERNPTNTEIAAIPPSACIRSLISSSLKCIAMRSYSFQTSKMLIPSDLPADRSWFCDSIFYPPRTLIRLTVEFRRLSPESQGVHSSLPFSCSESQTVREYSPALMDCHGQRGVMGWARESRKIQGAVHAGGGQGSARLLRCARN